MPQSKSANSKPMTDRDIEALSDIAGIAKKALPNFGAQLRDLFLQLAPVWYRFDQAAPKRAEVLRRLRRIEKTAAKLREEFEGLNGNAQMALGFNLLQLEMFGKLPSAASNKFPFANPAADLLEVGGGASHAPFKFAAYQKAIEEIETAAGMSNPRQGTTGGAPSKSLGIPGNPNVSAFDLLIIRLCHLVKHHGGDLTLNKNSGTGTLIDFLKAARTHLPDGLVPDDIFEVTPDGTVRGMSRLQRLKTLAVGGQKPPKK